jgi:hypothetical protein
MFKHFQQRFERSPIKTSLQPQTSLKDIFLFVRDQGKKKLWDELA